MFEYSYSKQSSQYSFIIYWIALKKSFLITSKMLDIIKKKVNDCFGISKYIKKNIAQVNIPYCSCQRLLKATMNIF